MLVVKEFIQLPEINYKSCWKVVRNHFGCFYSNDLRNIYLLVDSLKHSILYIYKIFEQYYLIVWEIGREEFFVMLIYVQ